MNARELLGSKVRDRHGQTLGTVEEIVVDRLTGRVSFAVVAPADADEPDNDLMPVPWTVLATTDGSDDLRLQSGARRIADAPRIDRDELDDLERRDVSVEVFSYYGVQPPWEGARRA
ncbi:MAG: PRC-barrel domain-containing protein [Acidobacteriota bacterium]|jgi:hypothetical protein